MRVLRQRKWKAVFLVVTGLTFLNMSFFMAEISALKGAYSQTAMENIVRMFTLSLSEEEHDHGTPESSGALKEFDLLEGNLYHLQFESKDVSNTLKVLGYLSSTHPGFLSIESPPPDSSRG